MKFRNFAIVVAALAGALLAQSAQAQQEFVQPAAKKDCKLLCAPKFISQSGTITTNWIDSPEVRGSDGRVFAPDTETDFLLRLTTVIPTEIPRFSLVAIFQWTPWADAKTNPFTGKTFEEGEVDANPPSIIYGGIINLITPEQTGGWFALNFNPLLVFSPAAEPEDERFYTHKLLPELYANVGIFNWLPKGNWLRSVSAYGILDYVATGLPDEGDPAFGGTLLEDADPWLVLAGLQFPIAPLP